MNIDFGISVILSIIGLPTFIMVKGEGDKTIEKELNNI